jgi:hypothetical protein
LLMEDPVPQYESVAGSNPGPTHLESAAPHAALPPASANKAGNWRPRPQTAEIYQPPSVTENTTRLLDKEDPKTR